MKEKLPRYKYINLDSGWNREVDEHGRWLFRPELFPNGLAELSRKMAKNGHKLGLYLLPGIPQAAVVGNRKIKGRDVYLSDYCRERKQGNAFPGTTYMPERHDADLQHYFDSVAELLSRWGVHYVKLDGCGPGSGDEIVPNQAPDCRATLTMMARAFRQYNIWVELSWYLDHRYADEWSSIANGARIYTDIESYSPQTMTTTARVLDRWRHARHWAGLSAVGRDRGFYVDLDAVIVGMTPPEENRCIDGLANDHIRRSYITFWALTSSVFCLGSDPRCIPNKYLDMLNHPTVLDIQQTGVMANLLPYYTDYWSYDQVWWKPFKTNTVVVGLFNVSHPPGKRLRVGFRFRDVLNAENAFIEDVWKREILGVFKHQYSVNLEAGECCLLLISLASANL
ncbi:glycoside hydrolase [Hesseltinella vesiculosa]|uniref:alpha-galactosidase n=1 Tax=Hesseltinella vesiculosa TaxID=101127 RepID=A0A1X2G7C2_9FUNG|nr:glycoside hydrolase [Hesseltinella vesiculosa]